MVTTVSLQRRNESSPSHYGKTSATPVANVLSSAALCLTHFDSPINAASMPSLCDFGLSPLAGRSAVRANANSAGKSRL